MNKALRDIVARLRTELNELTRVYVDRQYAETTAFMAQSKAVSAEIDNLEAFVLCEVDQKCLYILRRKMSVHLNRQETKTLIHDLGISDFDYTGNTISGMHAELVSYCTRHKSTLELIRTLKDKRPLVHWPDC